LTNLGSELEKCVGSRVHLVGVSISIEKNFYRLPFTPPPSLVRRIGPSACESATEPSCVDTPLHEHFPFGLCNASRAHAEALVARQAGKEIVSDYASDSIPSSGYYSDSSYEFDFGSDPDEPESENLSTEQPLSGPATGLVITSTPTGRFVYWPDRKPTDLTDGNSRYVAYLDTLPFQEGTPLAPTEDVGG
jgi:hypothetical protein